MTIKRVIFLYIFIAIIFSCRQEAAQEVSAPEKHRPRWHFTPPSMWMNDPNGMVYYEGEYHLFYQHYPDSSVWGPMHWGHAISRDLVNWQHQPIALYPDSLGYIFSGSAVVDWNNTSGFGHDNTLPMVAIFTYHDMAGEKAGRNDFQTQGIAYSLDRGRTWTKYAGNPVLTNPGIRDLRDPKVIWHDATHQWVMTLAAGDHVRFYTSPDLKEWSYTSSFGKNEGSHRGVWECPDLFPISPEGEELRQWVLLVSINPGAPNGGSGTQYFVGQFDGQEFVLDPAQDPGVYNWIDLGRDNYAGVTWSDISLKDGRRIFMGWMSNWQYAQVVPTTSWRSAMTLPRELQLKKSPRGWRLWSRPVEELKMLRDSSFALSPQSLTGKIQLDEILGFPPTLLEVLLEVEIGDNSQSVFGLEWHNDAGESYRVGFDAALGLFFSDRTRAGKNDFSPDFANAIHYASRQVEGKIVKLHVFVDVASAELFADEGATCITDIFFPSKDFDKLNVYAQNGPVTLRKAEFFLITNYGITNYE